jgi:hypothetical protein
MTQVLVLNLPHPTVHDQHISAEAMARAELATKIAAGARPRHY